MPIYEYVCTACDHRADILHGINDPGPFFCPSCGREGTMRKQFAPPAIHYKGTGWAKKDRGGSSSQGRGSSSSSSSTSAHDDRRETAASGSGSGSTSAGSDRTSGKPAGAGGGD